MTTIKPERAAVIAVLLLQYKYSRRGFELSQEAIRTKLKELEAKTGFAQDFIHAFIFRWLVPGVLQAAAPKNTKVPTEAVTEENLAGINGILAIKLLCLEHFQIESVLEHIRKVHKTIGVEEKDLCLFYFEYILPQQLANAFGWDWLSVHKATDGIQSGLDWLSKPEVRQSI